jgi:hypothetical protein
MRGETPPAFPWHDRIRRSPKPKTLIASWVQESGPGASQPLWAADVGVCTCEQRAFEMIVDSAPSAAAISIGAAA